MMSYTLIELAPNVKLWICNLVLTISAQRGNDLNKYLKVFSYMSLQVTKYF